MDNDNNSNPRNSHSEWYKFRGLVIVINRFRGSHQFCQESFGAKGILLANGVGNVIEGNFLGTDATGTQDQGNGACDCCCCWGAGIGIENSSNNIIGGTTSASRNIISANGNTGVYIAGMSAQYNVVQGNIIGTDVTGTAPLGNVFHGVWIFGAPNNIIGGTSVEARNIISATQDVGIYISGSGATGNLVQGNYIGTDVTGTVTLGNLGRFSNLGGVLIDNAPSNTIGGTVQGAGNLISGNSWDGITISGSSSSNNLVQGNLIGTDVTGSIPLGNGHCELFSGCFGSGITINNGQRNIIGGVGGGAGNVISGNTRSGVYIFGDNAKDNLVQGNFIGTDRNGITPLGNNSDGVSISISGGGTNIIGGAVPGAGNVISGNLGNGIFISASDGTIFFPGNFVGTDTTGSKNLGNNGAGVFVSGAGVLSASTTGALVEYAGNVIASNEGRLIIAFNGGNGVTITTPAGFSWDLRGSSIFSNTLLGIDLGNDGVTPNDQCDLDSGPNDLQNFPILTSAVSGGGSTIISGFLDSVPNTIFALEFFSNSQCDPSGYGQGETFIGTNNVVTAGNCIANFTVTFPVAIPVGSYVTATATSVV